jgi:two-component system sensor histidine kinase EvgS
VASIQASGKTLLSPINDILDLSKVESGKFELEYRPADVHAAVQDLERLFTATAAQKGIDFTVDIDVSLPGVLVIDEIRLRQVLVNLVSNAVKFTEQGGVGVRVSAAPTGERTVDLTFEVTDSGVGIPKDQQERIFGAFEQRDGQSINEFGGTGLGLAITSQLVALMGGELTVSSVVGEGSTFTVQLPKVTIGDAEALDK